MIFKMKQAWQRNSQRSRYLLFTLQGNFSLMTAFMIFILLEMIGLSINLSNIILTRCALQYAADNAILRASTELTGKTPPSCRLSKERIAEIIRNTIRCQLSNDFNVQDAEQIARDTKITIVETNVKPLTYEIRAQPCYHIPLHKFSLTTMMIREKTLPLSVTSTGIAAFADRKSQGGLSIQLVLDVSYSMTAKMTGVDKPWTFKDFKAYKAGKLPLAGTRLNALKDSVAILLGELNKNQDVENTIRTGIITYNDGIAGESKMAWGTQAANAFNQKIIAAGETNCSIALKKACVNMISAQESQEHKKKGNRNFIKYVVLMSDGVNSEEKNDAVTRELCDHMKRGGIQVFTVAFQAPARAQALLRSCASSAENYYNPVEHHELCNAFKKIGASVQNARVLLKE